jgi:GT2 family glycosyltransferase
MVVRADTLGRLGGLAASFFAYYEDTDWCWRAQLAGMTIRYDPSGVVRHVRSATSGGTHDPFVRLLSARNRVLCLVRNAPRAFWSSQLRRAWHEADIAGLRPSLLQHVPRQLAARRALRNTWVLAPAEVLDRWAGVDNHWGLPSQLRSVD